MATAQNTPATQSSEDNKTTSESKGKSTFNVGAFLNTFLSTIGSIADPIANIFISKDKLKMQKILKETTVEDLKTQIRLAEIANDKEKIILAEKALILKEGLAEEETKKYAVNGLILIGVMALSAVGLWIFYGRSAAPAPSLPASNTKK